MILLKNKQGDFCVNSERFLWPGQSRMLGLVRDANTEFGPEHQCYEGIGCHQCYQFFIHPISHANMCADFVDNQGLALLAVYQAHHAHRESLPERRRHTVKGNAQICERRIDTLVSRDGG